MYISGVPTYDHALLSIKGSTVSEFNSNVKYIPIESLTTGLLDVKVCFYSQIINRTQSILVKKEFIL